MTEESIDSASGRTGSTTARRALSTSRSLLARARARDPEAWERLVTLYAPYVFQTCRRAHLSPEDTADIFQEVFQTAFRKLDQFRREKRRDTFRGWLRVIARNKVNDHFRRRQGEPRGARAQGGTEFQIRLSEVRAPQADLESDVDPATEERAETQLLQRALERIRPHFRSQTWRAFLGTVVDGRSAPDVAHDLGMSSGAVRVAKSRVLQRLRTELGDLPVD